jgi:hypothetical protein
VIPFRKVPLLRTDRLDEIAAAHAANTRSTAASTWRGPPRRAGSGPHARSGKWRACSSR